MVAPIILYGSSVLRKYSAEITEEDNVIKISEMLSDTLKKAGGIGLAGPQINLLKRAFVIDTSPIVEDDITIEKLFEPHEWIEFEDKSFDKHRKKRTKYVYNKSIKYNENMIDETKQQEDFISTVSHELRTPLTSIRGFAQTMLASWDKLDDEHKKKFIQIMEQQSNRLINLVENMLSVNKLQSFKDKFVYKNWFEN